MTPLHGEWCRMYQSVWSTTRRAPCCDYDGCGTSFSTSTPLPCCSDPQATLPRHWASASSDGVVKLWDARMLSSSSSSREMHELAAVGTQARITCMCISPPPPWGPTPAGSTAKKAGGQVSQVRSCLLRHAWGSWGASKCLLAFTTGCSIAGSTGCVFGYHRQA